MIRRNVLPRIAPRLLTLAALAAAAAVAGCDKNQATQPVPLPPLRAVVLLSPNIDTVAVGSHLQLVAVGVDSVTGDTLRNLALSWTTNDASVATVTSTGNVTGVSEGSARIVVSGSGHADTAFVFVRPAQSGWFEVTNTQATQDLHGIYFLSSGRTGWAVGNAGTVLKSSDAGGTWTRIQVSTALNIMAVQFAGSTGYAVGANGMVLRSSNLGSTWTVLFAAEANGNLLRDVWALDALRVWAVGDGGTLIGTSDGGDHWTRIATGTVTNLNGIAFSGNNGWVVGDIGAGILGTRDGGASWYRILPGDVPNVALRGVARRSQPVTLGASGAVAVGPNGSVVRAATTTDSLAWVLQNAGANYDLNAVSLPIAQTVFAAGGNAGAAVVLASADGGVTWTPQTVPAGTPLNDVWFVDAYRGWAVGNGGRILHTATGGLP